MDGEMFFRMDVNVRERKKKWVILEYYFFFGFVLRLSYWSQLRQKKEYTNQ